MLRSRVHERPRYWRVLFVLAFRSAEGCSCFGGQPLCNSLPNLADENSAIFTGVVKDVYPETEEQYLRALSAALPSKKFPLTIEATRAAMLRLWQGVLTPEEEENIRTSTDTVVMPFKGIYWTMPRRVRFELLERFAGPEGDSFELFTGIGKGDCGVGFKKGDSVLVFAGRNSPSGRWATSICSRNQSVRSAGKDLATLRALKKGEPIQTIGIWDRFGFDESRKRSCVQTSLERQSGTPGRHKDSACRDR